MRRSRRSLVLLLASMALSLAVVRATSVSPRQTPAPANIKNQGASKVVPTRAPFQHTTQHKDHPPPTPYSAEPPVVSATAIILILPRASLPVGESVQIGWSGCTAYANGCDHLGRPLSFRLTTAPRLVDRLIVEPLTHLVQKWADVLDVTATAFSQTQAPTNLPAEVANGRARAAGESTVSHLKRFDLRL